MLDMYILMIKNLTKGEIQFQQIPCSRVPLKRMSNSLKEYRVPCPNFSKGIRCQGKSPYLSRNEVVGIGSKEVD